MNPARAGILWAVAFVVLESIQFVFFGNVFQRMNSFLFGALVLGITVAGFVGFAAVYRREDLLHAFANPRLLIAINVTATFAWAAFLTSVQMIEPAVAYTIGAGVMPLTTWLAFRFGVPEGEAMRNRTEALGNLVILLGLLWLAVITISGLSGFVRDGSWTAIAGVGFAVADGVFFVMLLMYCQWLDRRGVGPATVFGLRFPLYVLVAGMVAVGAGSNDLPASETAMIVGLGLLLVVPPLYALQRAVAMVSTLTLSAITALGPFTVFAFQMVEGRVDYSMPTLLGLVLYFVGAMIAAFGAVRAVTGKKA